MILHRSAGVGVGETLEVKDENGRQAFEEKLFRRFDLYAAAHNVARDAFRLREVC